jgi:Surface antigen variable number repeat/Thioredoxin-like
MPSSARFARTFLTFVYCFALLLPAVEASGQSNPQSKEDSIQNPPPVVVDMVKIEGGADLTADEHVSIKRSLQGEIAHSDWLDRVKANVTRQLQDDGFFNAVSEAKVESTALVDGKDHVVVSIVLTLGPRYSIQSVWWTGSSIFSTTQLDNLSLLKVGDVFRPSALSASNLLIRQAYADRGYIDAILTPQIRTDSKQAKVDLYLEVAEGHKSEAKKQLPCKRVSVEEVRNAPYTPSPTYDPKSDAQLQLARAQLEAQRTKKRLLLIVGGEWCGWCRVLEQTFQRNPALIEFRDSHFVVLHIDLSDQSAAECALKDYPKPPGVPFIYVLDSTGVLIATDDTKGWESGDGYDSSRIEEFLKKW